MDSTVAIILGAAISGMVGVLVVFIQQRLARQHELDSAKAARLSEFSAAGWAATLIISEIARAPIQQKRDLENSARFQALTDRFNSVLAQIQLLDDAEVYAAADRVDECLVALHHQARAVQATRERLAHPTASGTERCCRRISESCSPGTRSAASTRTRAMAGARLRIRSSIRPLSG